MKAELQTDGFALYDADPDVLNWVTAALPLADAALQNDKLLEQWLTCEGTWFVGVDALDTGPSGEAGATPLAGDVIRDLAGYLPAKQPMHKAQLSVVYPGYPKPRNAESDAAFRYRLKRDAAHVDGLHATGASRRRHVIEYHAYLLGLPLTDCGPDAGPLVVWRGSHLKVQDWLTSTLADMPSDKWSDVDLTDSYQALRKEIFETCERVELYRKPGEAFVMHRHVLHGIAPWKAAAGDHSTGRMIAYFRPEIACDLSLWLRDR